MAGNAPLPTPNAERQTPKVPTYLLINYEYPPLGGGAATASKNLAVALTRRGNRVIVLTSGLPKAGPSETCPTSRGSDEEGVTVIRVPAWRKSVHRSGIIQMTAYLLSACWRAPRIAREYQVERVLAFF